MSNTINISTFELLIGFTLLIIPVALFYFYKIKLIKDTIIGAVRMLVQLSLVAVYLEWIFNYNQAWLNILWVLVMIFVGVFTSIQRIQLNWKLFFFPFFLSSLTSLVIVDAFFLGYVIKLPYFFDARYFVPISGMVLGNALSHNIVGLTAYLKGLSEKSNLYYFVLTNSSNQKQALLPFIQDAIKQGLNPLIATMTVIGLISLPGMMTGQILGGSSPAVAIKYQILIMIAIFVGCTINLFFSILLSNRMIFDPFQRLKKEVFKK